MALPILSGRVGRLGVNGDAGDLRKLFADAVFERAGDVVITVMGRLPSMVQWQIRILRST
jgi:hypothetical protein